MERKGREDNIIAIFLDLRGESVVQGDFNLPPLVVLPGNVNNVHVVQQSQLLIMSTPKLIK